VTFETGELVVVLEFDRLQVALVSVPGRLDEVHSIAEHDEHQHDHYGYTHNQRMGNEVGQHRHRRKGGVSGGGVAEVKVQVNGWQ